MNQDISPFGVPPGARATRRSWRPAAVPLWTASALVLTVLLTATSNPVALFLSVLVGGPVLVLLLLVAIVALLNESTAAGVLGTVVVVGAGVVAVVAIATS